MIWGITIKLYKIRAKIIISKFIAEVAPISKLKDFARFDAEPRNFAGIFLVLIFL